MYPFLVSLCCDWVSWVAICQLSGGFSLCWQEAEKIRERMETLDQYRTYALAGDAPEYVIVAGVV